MLEEMARELGSLKSRRGHYSCIIAGRSLSFLLSERKNVVKTIMIVGFALYYCVFMPLSCTLFYN